MRRVRQQPAHHWRVWWKATRPRKAPRHIRNLSSVTLSVHLAPQDSKTVHFHLQKQFFEQIRTGAKMWEFRKSTQFWRTRISGATHAVFENGS